MINAYLSVLLAFSSFAGHRAPQEGFAQSVPVAQEISIADAREKRQSLFSFMSAYAMETDNAIEEPVSPAADALPARAIIGTRRMTVTAYSSTPEETDDTPFITASGTHVRDGIVATNQLPFGAQVQIPEYFGDKIFIVEDRMHRRKKNNMDIWMSSKEKALRFGITTADIVILE